MKRGLMRRLVLILFVFWGAAAHGAMINVVPAGPGAFRVGALELKQVARLDLTIGYDLETFVPSQVEPGPLIEGTISSSNTGEPGLVHLTVVCPDPLSGSGVVATLRGVALGDGSAGLRSIKASMVDAQGRSLPVAVVLETPPMQEVETPEAVASGDGGEADVGSDAALRPAAASLELPAENPGQPEKLPEDAAAEGGEDLPLTVDSPEEGGAEALPKGDGGVGRPSMKKTDPAVFVRCGDLLEPLRAWQGERNVEVFGELLSASMPSGIVQLPRMALADGKQVVAIELWLGPGEKKPDVAVSGAHLVSGSWRNRGTWRVEVLPPRGSGAVTVMILQGGKVREIPLLVAPELTGDFDSWCAAPQLPPFDLNGDDQAGEFDDYLLTVNCLARQQVEVSQVGAGMRR